MLNLKDSWLRIPLVVLILIIIQVGDMHLQSHFGAWWTVARGVIFIAMGVGMFLSKSPALSSKWIKLFGVASIFMALLELHSGLLQLGIVHF